jgi:DNA-nicking Smr family endonuclease
VKRPVKPDELRLWSMVAATVHPMPGRAVPKAEAAQAAAPPEPAIPPKPGKRPAGPVYTAKSPNIGTPPVPPPRPPPGDRPIEPRRKHRIAKERDPIGAHIDLHGLGQDQARAILERFVLEAWSEGLRAVLVITGKGLRGDGVLRRMTPEWLAAAHLRHVVAGVSEAHRRHGGEGALYIALKRKARE